MKSHARLISHIGTYSPVLPSKKKHYRNPLLPNHLRRNRHVVINCATQNERFNGNSDQYYDIGSSWVAAYLPVTKWKIWRSMSVSRPLAPIRKRFGLVHSVPNSSFIIDNHVNESFALLIPPAGLNPTYKDRERDFFKIKIFTFKWIYNTNYWRSFAHISKFFDTTILI